MFLHLSKGKHFPSFLESFLVPFLCQPSLVSHNTWIDLPLIWQIFLNLMEGARQRIGQN